MIRLPPRSTRTDTLFPDTTLFRSRLQLGYSHDVNIAVPEGLEVKTPDQTTVEISGIDRQKVGQLAAEIRRWRKPEPYKGKGIKRSEEHTSELQSLMRTSYAVFCLKKKTSPTHLKLTPENRPH